MMTAAARKMSFENRHLRNCDYFAITPSCSQFTMLAKNPTTGNWTGLSAVKLNTQN